MRKAEAVQVVQVLAAGFPHEALEPETVALWTYELCVLESADAARDAAMTIVRSGDKFPTLRQFRVAYRQASERLSPPALEQSSEREPIPIDAATWLQRIGGRSVARSVPISTAIVARPVWDRWLRRRRHEPLLPPTDAEKHDAILVLGEGRDRQGVIHEGWPRELVLEAERIFIEGSS